MIPPVIADTGGLLRALARTPKGKASFPEYEKILISASAIIIPGLVLAEVDYFLRGDRRAMRKLIAEIFDPATRYEYELPLPAGSHRIGRVTEHWHSRSQAVSSPPGLNRRLDLESAATRLERRSDR